jgi:general secretion pathway protein G
VNVEATMASVWTKKRRARRMRQEGMTLVEIMIVVIIMALIATAVGVAVVPRMLKAREESTRADAQAIYSAVQMYVVENPGGECPSVQDLVSGGKRTTDAWDNPFKITCEGENITVASNGADGDEGTDDDISTDRIGDRE